MIAGNIDHRQIRLTKFEARLNFNMQMEWTSLFFYSVARHGRAVRALALQQPIVVCPVKSSTAQHYSMLRHWVDNQ